MENTERVRFDVRYSSVSTGDQTTDAAAQRRELRKLVDTLRELGLSVSVSESRSGATATLDVAYPTAVEARRVARRGGKYSNVSLPDEGPIAADTPASDAWLWLRSHGFAEGCAALGLATSQRVTYNRRRNLLHDAPHGATVAEALHMRPAG